ncbi:chromosome segregation protein SMC [Thiospirochaeta perfilievii]|uniref:Chromosome segregation protein SMC n=1 Tax=Thiospirochaeta perfilievii TaxID=252967 RepID=A0A5C1QCJ3_9SPIO|nr:AAA family ATPase [Thiospirochaeta perfilievii]QEN04649.1 chromosome segregation protein SMC [Thiospirochaeta perfilievii]
MKILNLRFKNLNSLYGEWEIDFNHEEYITNGIFAITGETGAGKSTVLDAICLALYGATPRLGLISKSSNEIMSRKTGECFSEVTFKVNDGIYTCFWGQHRARKSPNGRLADAKHEISDFNTKDVLANKKRDVLDLVILKSGMDLERFTRSILLAQGSFSAFLKATADERAPILEQITGTEIYSDISEKVHEINRLEVEKHSILVAESGGISLLSKEEEDSLILNLEQYEARQFQLKKELEEKKSLITWLNRILELQKDLEVIEIDYKSILSRSELFEPKREFLQRVKKAAEIESSYALYSSLLNEQKNSKETLEGIKNQLPKIEEESNRYNSFLEELELKIKDAKEVLSKKLPILNNVRRLDYDIKQRSELYADKKREIETLEKVLIQLDKKLNEKIEEESSIKKEYLEVESYIKRCENDKELTNQLNRIDSILDQCKKLEDKIYFKSIERDKFLSKSEEFKNSKLNKDRELGKQNDISSRIFTDLEQAREDLDGLLGGKLLREYRRDLNSLIREKSLLEKITSLEDEREKLLDNSPCPLCGSLDHPYKKDSYGSVDETAKEIEGLENFIFSVEDKENTIKELESKLSNSKEFVSNIEKEIIKVVSDIDESNNNYKRVTKEILELNSELESNKESIEGVLKEFGSNSINSLKERSRLWDVNNLKSQNFRLSIKEIEGSILRTRESLSENKLDLEKKLNLFKESQTILEGLKVERYGLLKDENPDEMEENLRSNLEDLDKKIESLRVQNEDLKKEYVQEKTKLKTLSLDIERRELKISEIFSNFEKRYKELGFIDVDDFLKYRIDSNQRSKLIEMERELDTALTNIQSKKEDRIAQLEGELEKKLTNESPAEIKESISLLDLEINSLGEDIGGIKQKLDYNSSSKERFKTKEKEISAQKLECENWKKIHDLIGSADGKKFRNFAQGLTFERVIKFANRELFKLSDRYLLIRDMENPLELNVIDNYQAGEIRSTKNLSGGESFIISLALALGLSGMASNKVRVDSLFLDEGFGTLDENALDSALETLSSLHQDGKVIGVISHVPALKQRILTQINIRKNSGGRGTLSGPGCKHI